MPTFEITVSNTNDIPSAKATLATRVAKLGLICTGYKMAVVQNTWLIVAKVSKPLPR